jgi:hypothetical protein
VRMTSLIGDARVPAAGESSAARSCWRRSGEAFTSTHDVPHWTATESCVLGSTSWPSRALEQSVHPQFHCGTPPPAAVPKRRMRNGWGSYSAAM